MNLLFLDIDGVLNSVNYMKRRQKPKKSYSSYLDRHIEDLDPIAINLLRDFVVYRDVKIVVSSTWRILYSDKSLIDLFARVNWPDMPIIGSTPRLSGHRGTEVDYWLQDNFNIIVDPVYAIIDDDGDFFDYQPLVQTDNQIGIQKQHLDQLDKIYQV